MWTCLSRPSSWIVLDWYPQLLNRFNNKSPDPLQLVDKIIWNKRSMGTGWKWRGQYEEVLHFYRSFKYIDNWGKSKVNFDLRWFGAHDFGNLVDHPRPRIHRDGHQNEKPVFVIAQLLRAVTQPGDLIVDPVCGSGASLVAAAKLGLRSIGGDNDPQWVNYSARRLKLMGFPVLIKD